MQNMKEKLSELIESFNQLPYLFVGAGISMRYSHAVSWDCLLRDSWNLLYPRGTDKDYKKYLRTITEQLKEDYFTKSDEERKYYINPQIATVIQQEFNAKCLNDENFENSIFTEEEITEILEKDYDYYKYYIAKQIGEVKLESSKPDIIEVESLKNHQNKIAGVITTNYDKLLEAIFSDFEVMVGQDNLLVSNMNSIYEIFKIHGSCDNPNSIIITQNDYLAFKNKLTYLSAKLLTIFVEHPVIFLGYGIGDLNIREILNRISEGLTNQQMDKLKSNLIFISPVLKEGEREEIKHKEIEFNGKNLIMTEVVLKNYEDLYSSLSLIKSSMPVKLIRKMQDMFCSFMTSTEPTKNIMVGSLDNPNISDDQLGIYFGAKADVINMGFEYYGIWEIIDDILFDNKPYLMNEKIFTKTFKIIRSTAGKTFLPIYKYLNGLNKDVETIPKDWCFITDLDTELLNKTEKNYTKEEKVYNTIDEIVQEYSQHYPKQLAYIMFNRNNIETEDLGNYLRKIYKLEDIKAQYVSQFKKLVAVYDLKKNKK